MKIILVGPAHPIKGGIASFNESLCRALNAQGHDAQIISFSMQYPGFLFPGETQYHSGPGPVDLKITTLINSVNPLSWNQVNALVENQKPDLVVVRYWIPFMAPCLASIARAARKHAKVIAIADNVIPHEKRLGDKILTGYFVKNVDGFIVMSKSVVDDLKDFTNRPSVFLPHPIYDVYGDKVPKLEAQEKLGIKLEAKHILFFGFIRKYKGLDLLLRAMGDARVQDLGVKLIVAGEFYEDQQYYMDLIDEHGIKDMVIIKTGFIPEEDVKYYFCASDMVVQPYRSATQSGITQIAYNFERPMLVTNIGGLPEIVSDGKVGYVVEPTPVSISDAIVKFYEGKMEGAFTKAAGVEKQRFSWKSFVAGLEKLASGL